MSLSAIPLSLSYRSGRDDLIQDFFNPCLEVATLHRRAAGYFTSVGLALAARGVAHLASRRGKMQLVVSPYLEPADVEALQAAARHPAEALRAIAVRSLAEIEDALIKDRLNALGRAQPSAWLVAGTTPQSDFVLWRWGNPVYDAARRHHVGQALAPRYDCASPW